MRTIVDRARATACRFAMAVWRDALVAAMVSDVGGLRHHRLDHTSRGLVRAVVLATSSVLVAQAALPIASAALADTRTPAEATAHALDELANCRAQRRPECPTGTPTSTPTTTPTITPTATAQPLDTATPAPTAGPRLPGASDPIAAYVRPSSHPETGAALELALPLGRWDVQTDCGDRLSPWTDVELLGQVLHAPDDRWRCGIVSSAWVSDATCATSETGVCAADMDGGFWEWLAAQPPTDTPTAEPSPPPTISPVAPTRPSPPAAAGVQIQRVVQTVVSIQTVIVLVTPEVSSTATPRPATTRSPTATAAATHAPSPSATATVPLVVLVTPVPTPEAGSGARALVSDTNRLWLFGLVFGAAAVGATWFWFTRGRRRYVL
jgi:hypothetical protein